MKQSIPLAPLQKVAWFNLIVFAIAVALYLMAVSFFEWHFHRTLGAASLNALGMFGVCGLWGFGVYFNYDRKRRAKANMDEREQLISLRASMVGFAIFCEIFVVLCMGVWAYPSYVRHQTTVPIGFLPFLVMLCTIVFVVTQSIAILVQYKRSAADDTL